MSAHAQSMIECTYKVPLTEVDWSLWHPAAWDPWIILGQDMALAAADVLPHSTVSSHPFPPSLHLRLAVVSFWEYSSFQTSLPTSFSQVVQGVFSASFSTQRWRKILVKLWDKAALPSLTKFYRFPNQKVSQDRRLSWIRPQSWNNSRRSSTCRFKLAGHRHLHS